ncbi:MAG: YhfC family glutamic-type intramembrane protease [Oscillospiraceae bacterium]
MNTASLIPSVNIMTAGIIVFCSLFLPVILTSIGLAGKFLDTKAYLCGFGVYLCSELLFRAPVLSALLTDASFKAFTCTMGGLALVGGLSAGLIEDTIKYAVAGKFLKNNISYKTAISLGFGSLCCEIIFVLGFKYIGTLITMLVINNGSYSNTNLMNIQGTQQVIAEMNGISPVSMIFELAARISKGMFFLCSGTLIMKGIQQKNPLFWLMSVLIHSLFNCVLLLIPNQYVSHSIALFIGFMFMMYAVLAKDEFTVSSRHSEVSEKKKRKKKKTSSQSGLKDTYYQNSGIENLLRSKENNSGKRKADSDTDGERDLMAEIAKIIVENENILADSNLPDTPLKKGIRSKKTSYDDDDEYLSPSQDIREIYRRNMYRK